VTKATKTLSLLLPYIYYYSMVVSDNRTAENYMCKLNKMGLWFPSQYNQWYYGGICHHRVHKAGHICWHL